MRLTNSYHSHTSLLASIMHLELQLYNIFSQAAVDSNLLLHNFQGTENP